MTQRSPWGPEWADVAVCLEEIGWAGAQPLREVREGGYSPASRWVIERPDGERAFVKAKLPLADGSPDHRLDNERIVLAANLGPMLPAFHGARVEANSPGVVVLEDLSAARWGTPLAAGDADDLRAALDALAELPAPPDIRTVEASSEDGWEAIAVDPAPVLASGLVDAEWLDRELGVLVAAASSVDVTGTSLVHEDLWLQNWCRAERGAVLVDWTGGGRGHARYNHAWGEAGIRAAGGPAGRVLAASDPDHAGWAAHMSGYAASFLAGDIKYADDLPRLHATQAREAVACLMWVCEALDLEPPTIAPGLLAHGPWQP